MNYYIYRKGSKCVGGGNVYHEEKKVAQNGKYYHGTYAAWLTMCINLTKKEVI